MTGQLLERQLALAAVALLSCLAALAFSRGDGSAVVTPGVTPAPAPTAVGAWYEARVGAYGEGRFGRPTPCGVTLTRALEGIAHPVLPCGARLVVALNGREVDTRVVDRGPYGDAQDFSVTRALADHLGLTGVQTVRWRFSSG